MMHSAPLDTEQFQSVKDGERVLELDVFSYFYDHGFPVEEVTEAYAVVNEKPDSENTAHIVVQIETLSKPLKLADVATDQMQMWCCDCRDYQFNQGVDLSERTLEDWGHCKHILSVSREAKAKADDNQDTII